jgi:cardiolipin synthase A/B
VVIKLFILFTGLLVTAIIYYNLFFIINDTIIIALYPYAVIIGIIFGIGLFLNHYIEHSILNNIIKGILIIFFIFGLLSGILIWRNAELLNQYQGKRSHYMNQLMNITKKKNLKLEDSSRKGLSALIESNTGIPLTHNNTVQLYNDGKKLYDAMLEEINKAEHHIHIQFYILREDIIGQKFKALLIEKVQQGVKVRVIYDGLGSYNTKAAFIRELKNEGIEVATYGNIIWSVLNGKLNHRNHRKIVIIDGKTGFTGGVNIGDEYLDRDKNIGHWEDTLVKIEGDAVGWMQKIFLGDWYYIQKEKIFNVEYFPSVVTQSNLPVQIVSSGFDTHWNEISQVYFSIITQAKERVYIATPYLILNGSMMKALQTAALRGVDVRIIIPKKPDLFLVGWANESYFKKLLKGKVRIYQYDNGFLHAKVFAADNKILSIGSANLNNRSLYLDYEMNAIIYDEKLCSQMVTIFEKYWTEGEEITLDQYENPSHREKIKQFIGRFFSPVM